MEGYIKLYRQIEKNEFYLAERFTKTQAWVDLLLLATYKPRTIFIRGIEFNLNPGELIESQKTLAKRWMWSDNTVRKFLNLLSKRGQISIKVRYRISLISIVNWQIYQGIEKESALQTAEQDALQSALPIRRVRKKRINKSNHSFSIESISLNLNGKLFYKNNFFYITNDFKDELINNISGLSEERLSTEFYKMQDWLERNGKKKDYKRFIINWLSKNNYDLSQKNDKSNFTKRDGVPEFNPVRIYEKNKN